MDGATLGKAFLSSIRKWAQQATQSKPVSTISPFLLVLEPLLSVSSMIDYYLVNQMPPQSCVAFGHGIYQQKVK